LLKNEIVDQIIGGYGVLLLVTTKQMSYVTTKQTSYWTRFSPPYKKDTEFHTSVKFSMTKLKYIMVAK